jgi:hypothetical protein
VSKPPASSEATIEVAVHPDVLLDPAALREQVCRAAGVRADDPRAVVVTRRTIDARHGKVRIHLRAVLTREPPQTHAIEPVALATLPREPEVAIVGAGPAGLFCAWALAQLGIAAIVLERGKAVRGRRHDLAALVRHGTIDPDSNYCFGEGGAGTFSDGKLYTRADKRGEVAAVLRALVAYGAPPEIMVDARPHIGTNRLPKVVGAMREHLESAGVQVVFESRVDALQTDGDRVTGVRLGDGRSLDVRAVVLAPGHSARDVQAFCREAGVALAFKPFAIGVRVEHPQVVIDRQQYGSLAGHPALGAASYRLVERAGGVGVFSFCMCPGGFIAPAATSEGELVVNGWSPSSRSGRYANSGFVVEIDAARLHQHGLDPGDPLSGVALQSRLERLAFTTGGGDFVAPAQRIADFIARKPSSSLPECSYPRGVRPAELDAVLGELAVPLREAMTSVGRKLRGFTGPDGIAVALESRTSCPVRILRDGSGQSPSHRGLFPCGEGAGFAGGIMSAALDGVRTAVMIGRAFGRSTDELGVLVGLASDRSDA